MTIREREYLKKRIIKLIDKLFGRPHVADKRRLGKMLCDYFGITAVDGVYGGLNIHDAISELYPHALECKSLSTYKLCMRLVFVCKASLARRLDTAKVSWRKVVAAISTKLSAEANTVWLERLVDDPAISMDEIKMSYSADGERNIRLPRNVDEGCEKFRKYALRLSGYVKGLQARLVIRRSQRISTTQESSLLSAAEDAGESLAGEVQSLLGAIRERRHVVAEQPLRERAVASG